MMLTGMLPCQRDHWLSVLCNQSCDLQNDDMYKHGYWAAVSTDGALRRLQMVRKEGVVVSDQRK
jgi:hypothetical protein